MTLDILIFNAGRPAHQGDGAPRRAWAAAM